MEKIEFGDLRLGKIAKSNLLNICKTNWASMGPKVREFEIQWSNLFDYTKSVAVSSGTDACMNACMTLYDIHDIEYGDGHEVIVPALSFIATSNAVRAAGFRPRFVDIKKETLNIDEDKIEEQINSKTVAIMPVHTMGRPCEMDKIMALAMKYDLTVIEDACEAHGARYKGKFIGHWGDMAVFSYYIAHLICCGEGGMVSTNSEEIAELLSSTRSHGRPFGSIYFDHQRFGLNSKMNDMEASLGLEGVDNFWTTFNTRHMFMKRMRKAVEPYEDLAWFSEEDAGNVNCPHGFSITCKREGDIENIKRAFDKYRIHWKRNFGCIPTQHWTFNYLDHELGEFPEAEWVGDNGIHIGCHQYLTDENLQRIDTALVEGFESL